MSQTPSASLTPPVVLISGYRGLAETLIETFQARDYQLSVLVRQQKAVTDLQKKYPRVHFFVGDVASDANNAEWIEEAHRKFGRIDGLINNAAITGPVGLTHLVQLAEIEEALKINLLGTISLAQRVIPHFLRQGQGVLINLSGGGATASRPRVTAYALSKTAVVRFTENLAVEYPEFCSYALSPGMLKTNMIADLISRGADNLGAEFDQIAKKASEGGEDPKKAASLALWLFENKPKALSGKLISALYDVSFLEKAAALPEGNELWTLRRADHPLFEKMKKIFL